jgi:hypothetical protein
MRRTIAYGLRVASAPAGVAVGLWMAQVAQPPGCPVRGLGTAALCMPVPAFQPSLCVLVGAAVAAVFLMLSIVIRRPTSMAATFDLTAAGGGVAVGLWTTLPLAFDCQAFCIAGPPFLAAWQSSLIGAAAAAAIVIVGCAASANVRRANLDACQRVQRWLFTDLSRSPKEQAGVDAT